MIGALVALCTTQMIAQPDDKKKPEGDDENVEVQIDGNKVTIEANNLKDLSELDLNAIVKEVTARSMKIQQQQKELLAQVDKQLANGEISEEQAEDMRDMINDRTEESMEKIGELMEAWGDAYEARMDAWEEQYEAQMEAWQAQVEAQAGQENAEIPPLPPLPPVPPMNATPGDSSNKKIEKIIIGNNGIIIKRGSDGDEPFALRFKDEEKEEHEHHQSDNKKIESTDGYFDINFGFNQQLRGGKEFIYNSPDELKFWGSNEFNLGFGGKTRIGSPFSKFYIKYGGEFSFHDFKLQEDNYLRKTGNGTVDIVKDTSRSITFSKYKIAYFNVPVMLQLDFSKVGQRDESFTIGVGGYAGLRLGAKRKMVYSDELYNNVEETLKDDFYTNQFRYGLMAQIGFGSFKITGKYDLNKFFREDHGPDYQLASVTIGWTL